jgi:hypothetical protein
LAGALPADGAPADRVVADGVVADRMLADGVLADRVLADGVLADADGEQAGVVACVGASAG